VGIVAEDVASVRAASDLVQIAGEHTALRRVGRRWAGLCPFHAEKTASFSVNAEEGLYYCFGCGAKGDVITFVREVEHLDFADAVERLASRAGIEIRHDVVAASQDHKKRARLVDVMVRAVEWYHQRMMAAPDAASARAYVRSRGYDADVVRAYRLGWAPDEWDALARSKIASADLLNEAGLCFVNSRGRRQDSFRARLMFPIFDAKGDPVAFGGRIMPGGRPPKYKNSGATALYAKSSLLYGLNWAKSSIVEKSEAVLCEGYTDVIGLVGAGVPHAVATCGTAVTDDHLRTLANYSVRRVVLAYDADAAGQAVAERFYEWERSYGIDIAVAALPAGTDPGDLAQRDPEALKAAVQGALPLLAFRLERALGGGDLGTPEGRARAAEAALAVISEHPSDLVKDQYVMAVADRCRLRPEQLRTRLAAGPKTVRERAVQKRAPARLPPGAEVEALKLAIHRPEAVAAKLDEVLFANPSARAGYSALASSSTLHQAIEMAEPGVAELLHRLAAEECEADPDDVVALLAQRAAERAVVALEAEARRAGDVGAYDSSMSWLKLTIEDLRDTTTMVAASDRLVGWLVEHGEAHT